MRTNLHRQFSLNISLIFAYINSFTNLNFDNFYKSKIEESLRKKQLSLKDQVDLKH